MGSNKPVYIGRLDLDHRDAEYHGDPIVRMFDESYLMKPFKSLIDYLIDQKPDPSTSFNGFTTDTERYIAEKVALAANSAGITPVIRVKNSAGNERSHSLTDIVGDAELIDEELEEDGRKHTYKKLDMCIVPEGHAGYNYRGLLSLLQKNRGKSGAPL